jgi:predicted  nucleic acid-binding Zn-ribbon protein
MAGFNEDIRVKLPALTHLTRLGYTYRSLRSMHHDPETNIDTDTFTRKLRELNEGITDSEQQLSEANQRIAQLEQQLAVTKAQLQQELATANARCQELQEEYDKTVGYVRQQAVYEARYRNSEAKRRLRDPQRS